MECVDSVALHLIEEYKVRPNLWDPSHPEYKLLDKKQDEWASIADKFEVGVKEVKKKMASLLASLRRERAKERKAEGVYRSKWFAYSAMTFLVDKFKEKDTKMKEVRCNSVSINTKFPTGRTIHLRITE